MCYLRVWNVVVLLLMLLWHDDDLVTSGIGNLHVSTEENKCHQKRQSWISEGHFCRFLWSKLEPFCWYVSLMLGCQTVTVALKSNWHLLIYSIRSHFSLSLTKTFSFIFPWLNTRQVFHFICIAVLMLIMAIWRSISKLIAQCSYCSKWLPSSETRDTHLYLRLDSHYRLHVLCSLTTI